MEKEEALKPTTTYTFKYESADDSIDLNTLLLSQIHFSTILGEIKNTIASDSDLSIKINSSPFNIYLDVLLIMCVALNSNAFILIEQPININMKLITILIGVIPGIKSQCN